MTHTAGARSFQRCNTGQGGKLRFTQAWPRRSKLGNQGCRCQWTQASDGLERGEPPRDSALELAVELLLLICQQRQLCGHLPNRLFAVAGKDTLARRGVGIACADACPGGQIRDARFVRRIAQKQQSLQPIADAGHIGDHVEHARHADRWDRQSGLRHAALPKHLDGPHHTHGSELRHLRRRSQAGGLGTRKVGRDVADCHLAVPDNAAPADKRPAGGRSDGSSCTSQRCLTRLGRSQTNSGGARMGTWQTGRIDCPCRGAVRLALQICAVLVWFGQLAEV